MDRIGVIGGGSWGTALSVLLTGKGHPVSLWVYDPAQAEYMRSNRENTFLPGHRLAESIEITTSIPTAVEGADILIFVPPSSGAADVAEQLRQCAAPGIPIVSATKGLDGRTGLTITQMLTSVIGDANPIVALSGPNLAVEVAKGVPTATVAACADETVARRVQSLLMSRSLRVYTNTDVVGVELAGALKNVLAIGAGICDGLGYGDNTKAAMLTRGLAEITRLGVRIGARPTTFMGLAGIGDLIATCSSPLSRNYRVGLGLGQGRNLAEITAQIGQVTEGVPTAKAARDLARRHEVPMPITEEVCAVLFDAKCPKQAVIDLMCREPKDEVW